jgi:hypothetical protein
MTTPLPFTVRLRSASVAHFGEAILSFPLLVSDSAPRGDERLPLAAVCILSRTLDTTSSVEIQPIPPAEVLAAVLPHAYCFSLRDLERKRRMMQNYLKLSIHVPVLSVRFQPGLAQLDTVLDAIDQALNEP